MDKVMVSRFDGRCKTCGGRIAAGDVIRWSRDNGARHRTDETCEAFKAARATEAAAPAVTANGAPIAGFLSAAKGRGLKFPKVAFMHAGRELSMYIAGERSHYPGAIQVKVGGQWVGRIEVGGTVAGPMKQDVELLARLDAIAANPATAAAEYGKLTGSCSFCAKQLTDEGSIEVGYGPVCAKRYGLPHTAKGSKTLAA
jgi:hypothetical protein